MGFDATLDLEKKNKVQGSMSVVITIPEIVLKKIILVNALVNIPGEKIQQLNKILENSCDIYLKEYLL